MISQLQHHTVGSYGLPDTLSSRGSVTPHYPSFSLLLLILCNLRVPQGSIHSHFSAPWSLFV